MGQQIQVGGVIVLSPCAPDCDKPDCGLPEPEIPLYEAGENGELFEPPLFPNAPSSVEEA